MRRRGQIERHPLGARRDVLHDDGAEEPAGHRVAEAGDPHPARNGGDVGVEQRRHHHAAADLLSDAGVAIRLGVDVCRPPRFEQHALVRRTAGHRQVAERAPDFIPRHLAVAVVLEAGGAHGHRFHAFVESWYSSGRMVFSRASSSSSAMRSAWLSVLTPMG